MQDLTQLTETELEDLRAAMFAELDRRNKLRDIPNEVASLRTQFEAVGGTKEQLIDKLNEEAVDE